jgi:glycerophosphoryl diester phosphodiesterase
LEDKLLAQLEKRGWNRADAPVFIQSFETANLKALRSKTKARLVQLVDAADVDIKTGAIIYAAPFDRPYDWTKSGRKGVFGDLLTPAGLAEVKTYADVIAPWKRYLVTVKSGLDSDGNPVDLNGDGLMNDSDGATVADDSIVRTANALGLQVHTWTFRNEPFRLASTYANDPIKEYEEYFAMGVTGVFSDFPDTARKARDAFWASR